MTSSENLGSLFHFLSKIKFHVSKKFTAVYFVSLRTAVFTFLNVNILNYDWQIPIRCHLLHRMIHYWHPNEPKCMIIIFRNENKTSNSLLVKWYINRIIDIQELFEKRWDNSNFSFSKCRAFVKTGINIKESSTKEIKWYKTKYILIMSVDKEILKRLSDYICLCGSFYCNERLCKLQ